MKTRRNSINQSINQQGIGHVVALFVIVFLAVVGVVGYKVVTMNRSVHNLTSTTASTVKAPSAISTKADLVQAGKSLDSSSAQVNSSLNDNSLDFDLNDML